MPPTHYKEKKSSFERKAKSGEFPVLGPSSSKTNESMSPSAKSLYEEVQADELIALASIYGEDFKRLTSTHVAWNKPEPCFEIYVKSLDGNLTVTLHVILTASYPKSPPLLKLKDCHMLKESTRLKLQKIIESMPKELAAKKQAMIMEIADACSDILEDAAQVEANSRNIPSLEMERSALETAATKLAQEARELEEEQKQLKAIEKERIQETLVLTEISRQKAKAKEVKQKNRPPVSLAAENFLDLNFDNQPDNEILCFERPIRIQDAERNIILFQAVTNRIILRHGPSSNCYTVKPVVPKKSSHLPILVLKQTVLALESKTNDAKAQVQLIESNLRSLRAINHRNILEIFDFLLQRTIEDNGEIGPGWTISILTEFAEKGSLKELIEITGSIGSEKVRSWTIELLDALRFLHENGIVHEDIHPGNVLLVRSFSGEVRVKLADSSYQKKLHNLSSKRPSSDPILKTKSAHWIPPEVANSNRPILSQKTDIWDFGILFLQMIFGLTVIENYSSPIVLVNSLALTMPLREFILMIFMSDHKKRPRAVELSPSEFLATDASFYERLSDFSPCSTSIPSLLSNNFGKIRSVSKNRNSSQHSRYLEDFVEVGRLGKGGFGEVVKARKKLDGQVYAIKKIVQRSSTSLTEILKEVHLLSQLSHPSVVRYYNTWTEEVSDEYEINGYLTETDFGAEAIPANELLPDTDSSIEYWDHKDGLDFMSSSKYPTIEFGYDDSTDEEDEEEDENLTPSETSAIKKDNEKNIKSDLDAGRSRYQNQGPRKTVLYISMEYCEKQTLRDLIKRELNKENQNIWRLFGEILEGLSHIHSLNIVHRDLKPENIFINAASNVKIGDFGLATSGQYTMTDKTPDLPQHNTDMTRNVGTAFYVAPEAKSIEGGTYTSKVDMYSLGIIFFEMCYRPLVPGMDRAMVGEGLRGIKPLFPADFPASERQAQADIILSLLIHNPEKRPSSSEILQSGKLPLKIENKSVQQVLVGLTDTKSPYREKMMKTLFSLENDWAKDYAWEMEDMVFRSSDLLLLRSLVKQKLMEIFRHHGAVETTRTILFPRSCYYGSNALTLLDEHGTVLQLPYDLTLPHARMIAKHQPTVERSFAFGQVFRDRQTGGQPKSFGEVDFDIVSTSVLDSSLKEAEVIKVLDEIVGSFPSLTASKMCFHINHSDLLAHVFDFCRIDPSIRYAVANTLSKLNFQSWNWQNIQLELRSPLIGMSAPSVDDLQRFDFKDTPNIAFEKLRMLFEGTDIFEKASPAITHLREVIDYTKRFEIKNNIYVTPLGSLNEKFYKGGVFFTCLFDRKSGDVFAVGGQYDSLIQEHRHKTSGGNMVKHAVGFNLAWEKIVSCPKTSIRRSKKTQDDNRSIWKTKRCDVLVASHDASILRTVGISLLQILWSNSISAELARDSHSPEDLLSKYRGDQHSWIVIIKQDSMLKVKSMDRKDAGDVDIPSTQLLSFLKTEMRERDRKYGTQQRESLPQMGSTSGVEYEQDVRVLIAGTKTKKSNRRKIVEQAQNCALSLTQDMLNGPVVAIETTDHVMDLIRTTRLSESETWRSTLQMVSISERRYLGEVHEMLLDIKEQNANVTKNAFVYNFRSGKCIYYDLGL